MLTVLRQLRDQPEKGFLLLEFLASLLLITMLLATLAQSEIALLRHSELLNRFSEQREAIDFLRQELAPELERTPTNDDSLSQMFVIPPRSKSASALCSRISKTINNYRAYSCQLKLEDTEIASNELFLFP